MTDQAEYDETSESGPPAELAPPIDSRFLFVDVASQRANQLRRGARVRLQAEVRLPHKLERAAMEEVRHRLVQYALPELPTSRAES
jgi:DNA-directed RNA polymerase subunit K/omega